MKQPLLLLATLCVTNAGAQTIYRCADAAGKPVYQQHACAVGGAAVALPPANVMPSQLKADQARASALRKSGSAGQVKEGMTEAELRQALGEPAVVNLDRQAGKGMRQQWVYRGANGDTRTLLLHDGVVTGEKLRPNAQRSSQRCPTQREIDNERVGASSTTIASDQKKLLQARIQRMEACSRPKRSASTG